MRSEIPQIVYPRFISWLDNHFPRLFCYGLVFAPFINWLSGDKFIPIVFRILFFLVTLVAFSFLIKIYFLNEKSIVRSLWNLKIAILTVCMILLSEALNGSIFNTKSLPINSFVLFYSIFCFLLLIRTTLDFSRFSAIFAGATSALVIAAIYTGGFGESRSGVVLGLAINQFGFVCSLSLTTSLLAIFAKQSFGKSNRIFYFMLPIQTIGIIHSGSFLSIGIVIWVGILLLFIHSQRALGVIMISLGILCGAMLNIDVKVPSLLQQQKAVQISNSILDQRQQGIPVDKQQGIPVDNVPKLSDSSRYQDTSRSIVQKRDVMSSTQSLKIRLDLARGKLDQLSRQGLRQHLLGSGTSNVQPVFVFIDETKIRYPHFPHNSLFSFYEAYGLITTLLIFGMFSAFCMRLVTCKRDDNWLLLALAFIPALFFFDLQWTYLLPLFLVAISQVIPNAESRKFSNKADLRK